MHSEWTKNKAFLIKSFVLYENWFSFLSSIANNNYAKGESILYIRYIENDYTNIFSQLVFFNEGLINEKEKKKNLQFRLKLRKV